MITLYAAGPKFGLPEVSPFCTKTEVQLKMAGLEYRKERSAPMTAPKGKLPWIEDDGEVVADSHFIRRHIERKYKVDFDEGLNTRQRAEAWAIERTLEDHLNWTMLYFRWLVPENFAKGPSHFFDEMPEDIRDQMRAEVLARVRETHRLQGIGRHTEEEILDLGAHSLAAFAALLGDRLYLMGGQPCGADATAFGVLAGVMTPFFDTPLRRQAEALPNIVGYVERMMLRYYPDFVWGEAAESLAA